MTLARAASTCLALTFITLGAYGCCNQFSESLHNAESRSDLINRLNENNKECQLKSTNSDASTITYTCENRKVSDIEVELQITACESFMITGIGRIRLIGEDGKRVCTVAENCECLPSEDDEDGKTPT